MKRDPRKRPEAPAKIKARMHKLEPPGKGRVTARKVVKTRQGYQEVTKDKDFALRGREGIPKVTRRPVAGLREGEPIRPGLAQPKALITGPAQELPNYMRPQYQQRLANADARRRAYRSRQGGPYSVPGQTAHYDRRTTFHKLDDRPGLD
jgi:hypothetical protein